MNLVLGRPCSYCQIALQTGEGISVDVELQKYGVQKVHFCCRYDSEYWKLSLGDRFIRWASEFTVGARGEKLWKEDRFGILQKKNDDIWKHGRLFP